ncbi:hypothetical protein [Anaerotignum sp.]|uniref:hypothetical protein n=1 Tax=Anaerotignum sp. TaxID=2039241 RepID=UPI002896E4AC|nr:hypothetical protein [Anaerotignum sp.]
MIGVSEVTNEKEIIFPEVAALVIGGLILDKQPWKVRRMKMILLMTYAAIIGVLIVRVLAVPLIFKVAFGFVSTAFMLILTRCNFLPMLSACILPIIMETTSIIYPISVCVMTVVMICVQVIFGITNVREKEIYYEYSMNLKLELKRFTYILIVILALLLIGALSDNIYLIAPPLIVTFVELTYEDSKARKIPLKIFTVVTLAAWVGVLISLIVTIKMGQPLIVSGLLITSAAIFIFTKSRVWFPPAGAIALLPLIIDSNKLLVYALDVMIGVGIYISAATHLEFNLGLNESEEKLVIK